ncbi:hypothetical protein MMC15_007064 [Xylographa vitiligo]|nr:hypothetical protein [Xylographa vitiligo]
MSIFHPTPTFLATAIHALLTRACSPHPLHSYQTGLLAPAITPSTPVLACLAHLSTSPHATPRERLLFASTHTRLSFLLAQEAARVAISPTQLLLNALLLDDLAALFDADRRARWQTLAPLETPALDGGGAEDAVAVMLRATVTMLGKGCEAFRGGVLRTSVSGPKGLLVALEGLSRDGRLEEGERRVFGRAKEEVARLWARQRQGAMQRPGVEKRDKEEEDDAMYTAYWEWWRPVLAVLQRDRERRGGVRRREHDGRSAFAAALASGEWPVRESGSVDGRSVSSKRASETGSAGLERKSEAGSLGASFRRKLKGVFK